jgi:hypothetical protein
MTETLKETEEAGRLKAIAEVGWQDPRWYSALVLLMSERKEYAEACLFKALQDLEQSTAFA